MTTKTLTLTAAEINTVLTHITTRKHSVRNRLLIVMNHYSGMKVHQLANITIGDVVDSNNNIRDSICVPPAKNGQPHNVVLSDRVRTELAEYLKICNLSDPTRKLFYTQKNPRAGFNSNTLTQFFFYVYRAAGIQASSHSGRKGFINALAKNGTNTGIIQQLTGHANKSSVKDQIIVELPDHTEQQKKSAVESIRF